MPTEKLLRLGKQRRWLWILVLAQAVGCGSGSSGMRVWGVVPYQGQPIQEGQIVFVPIEGTQGPPTGAPIQAGRYEIPPHIGPRANGVYRVEITAMGQEKTYTPNVSGEGPFYTVREQILPAQYNRQSTLRVTIWPDPAKNQHEFHLK